MYRNAFRAALILTLVAGFGLAGCGRKNRLEPPPSQNVAQSENGNRKADPGIQRPHRKLPLDMLLN